MGRRNKMENRIEALQTNLKKLTDEVQKIPTMENNITALLEEMAQLRLRQEATETLIQKMQEKKEPQSSEAKRSGELQQQRLPDSLARRMLELPMFDGTDSPMWILKMERYFKFHRIDDTAKTKIMDVIALCMSGQALDWFRCVQHGENPPGSWDEFRHALFKRFENGDTMYDRFIALQQEGSVRDYCSQFELLGGLLLPDIPDCILEAKFMNGLKAEVRAEVRMLQPKGIEEIMRKARFVEEKNNVALNFADVDTSFKTMKFKGTLEDRSVVVKIASGVAYNLISQNLATELKLPWDYTGDYCVDLGNGKTIEGDRIFRGVMLQFQNLFVFEDFLPLEMGENIDFVLGMSWLVTLGEMEVDWKALTMKMKMGRETVTLQGDPAL